MESRPWLGRPEVDCLHLTASQRRRRKKALKEAEKAPTSPVAAPSPESALADTVDQAKPGAEVTPLAMLVAAVECMAAARLLAPFALRRALVALIDSGLSDRTLYDGETLVTSALNAVYEHRSYVVVYSAELRVVAAVNRAAANLDTGFAAGLSLDGLFARTVALMGRNRTVLSVQTDGVFALADHLSLGAEHTRVGVRAGAFPMSFIALMEHGAALVSAAEPALNRVFLSATAFLSARLVTEFEDFAGTLDAVALVVALSRDAGAVEQALEVLSFCCCDGSGALLTLEPAKVELLASSSVLYASLEHCLDNHTADRGVVLSLLNTLESLAAVLYHRLQDHPHAAEVSLAISKLIVRIVLANAADEQVQVLGCAGLGILCSGHGLSRYPTQMDASFLMSAISAGAVVPVAAALRSHHSSKAIFTRAPQLLPFFFDSGAVDVAPYTDLVQICVDALDRLVLAPVVTRAGAIALASVADPAGYYVRTQSRMQGSRASSGRC